MAWAPFIMGPVLLWVGWVTLGEVAGSSRLDGIIVLLCPKDDTEAERPAT